MPMMEDEVKKIVEECFDKYDRNKDGFLDFWDVVQLMRDSYDKSGMDSVEG